jgi:hypothetical protein
MCADLATKLPVAIAEGDVNGDDIYSDRLLQGIRLKWVDKIWTMDGAPARELDCFLVTGTGFALQRWVDGLPEVILREPGRPLPNVDELNEQIPRAEWPIGKFSNEPERPWKIVAFAHFVRTTDAGRFTHINSTFGTRICVRSIRERIRDMAVLRGTPVSPIVTLTSAPMRSKKFPGRFRPELEVIEWRDLGGNQQAQIEAPETGSGGATERIGKPVAEPTPAQEMNDAIPF